jgi:hypothetical protein
MVISNDLLVIAVQAWTKPSLTSVDRLRGVPVHMRYGTSTAVGKDWGTTVIIRPYEKCNLPDLDLDAWPAQMAVWISSRGHILVICTASWGT